jgi:septal ring factor EnvC (AmiA/AmiB activator)
MTVQNAKRKDQKLKLRFKIDIIRKTQIIFIILLLCSLNFLPFHHPTSLNAEPDCNNPAIGDIDFCLDKIQKEIDALKPAHEYNKKELEDLRVQISSLTTKINALSKQLIKTESDIQNREEDLAYAQRIFEEKTKQHYKYLRFYDSFQAFLSSNTASNAADCL